MRMFCDKLSISPRVLLRVLNMWIIINPFTATPQSCLLLKIECHIFTFLWSFSSYPGQCSVIKVEGEATGFSLLPASYLIVVYCTYLNGHLRAHVKITAWYKTIEMSSSQSGERVSRHETLRLASLLFEMALNEAAFLSLRVPAWFNRKLLLDLKFLEQHSSN